MAGIKDFNKPKILRIAKRALKYGTICNNCLGRELAQISTGLTNKKRGEIIRRILKLKEPKTCKICGGLFRNLDKYAKEALEKLKPIQFKTFLVGSRLSPELIKKEENFWEEAGIEYCEPMKSELNRELGKLIEKGSGKEFKAKNPDINIFLNLERDRVEIRISSLFIYGEYKKLVRGIPQTKWEKYPETVEDIIAKPIMDKTQGSSHSLHASGREDIDARCLDWRPFVFEVEGPRKRGIILNGIEKAINKTGKVMVRNLHFSDKKEVIEVKHLRPEKTYRILVKFRKAPKSIRDMEKLVGVIDQKTPNRVLHRRADLLRKRRLREIKFKKIKGLVYEITVRGEAGLYAKELVTGDNGRTRPSVAEILKTPVEVLELDVIRIHLKPQRRHKNSLT